MCRREVEFEDQAPRRCKAREGGCGVSGGMRVLRTPSRRQGTAGYAPPARLSVRARDLEAALEAAACGGRGGGV